MKYHPVQVRAGPRCETGQVASEVALRAYEVYKDLYGEQEAIVTGDCRGGFSAGELVAFLYARSFPKAEWRARVEQALRGMRMH